MNKSLLLAISLTLWTSFPSQAQKPKSEPKKAERIWDQSGPVFSIAYAREGKLVVTAGVMRPDAVVIWDAATGKRLRGLQGTEFITSISISSDGKRIAGAGFVDVDKKIRAKVAVWDLDTGKELLTIRDEPVTLDELIPSPCVAYSPDGKLLATDSVKIVDQKLTGLVQLWEASKGKALDTLVGESSAFGYIAFSPDGKTLAAASFGGHDRMVVLWDVAKRKRRFTLQGKKTNAVIRAIAFSPDSMRLAWAAGNEFIRHGRELFVWNVITGKQIADLTNDTDWSAVAFDPRGKSLVAVDLSGQTFRVWDAGTLKQTAKFEFLRDIPWAASSAISPDGKTLVIGGGLSPEWNLAQPDVRTAGDIRLFDIATGRERLAPEKEAERAADEAAFAKHLAIQANAKEKREAGLRAELTKLTPTQRGRFDQVQEAARRHLYALHLTQAQQAIGKGRLEIAKDLLRRQLPQPGLDDLRSFEWYHLARRCRLRPANVKSGDFVIVRKYEKNSGFGIYSLVFSPDGQRLGLSDGASAFELDFNSGAQRKLHDAKNSQPVSVLRYSAGGKAIVTSSPGPITVWDLELGRERASIDSHGYTIGSDPKLIFVPRDNGAVTIYSSTDGKRLGILSSKDKKALEKKNDGEPATADVWSSTSGKWAAVGRWAWIGTPARVWDVQARKEIKRWDRGVWPVQFGFTPDDKTLVTADWKGVATVWDLPEFKHRCVLSRAWAQRGVSAIAPDSRTAAFEQPDRAVSLFDLATGEEIARLVGLTAPITTMVFTPDGKSLLTGSEDGTLRFWCPVTGAQRLSLPGHKHAIKCLSFSADTATLATGDVDAMLRIWLSK